LKSGDDVAVKVQRPGVDKTIEVDLEIMLHLATLAERHVEELSLHRPIKIVEEFARTLENEIDYQIEAANMERIGEQFLGNSTVYIPKVFRDTTTSRILTTEYIDGIKISDTERLKAEGYDCRLITERGATISLQQIFEYGFFHADPHPGNLFVLPGNVICLLDFGMVGIVDRNTREDFVALVHSIIRRDETRVAQVLLKLTIWEERPEARAFERDIADFLGQHLYKPLKEISLARLLTHLLETATRHRLRIPPDIFLMMKALSNVEGVARLLDPEFDLISLAEPYVKKIMTARVAPERLADDLHRLGSEAYHFLQTFPKDVLEISRLIRQQKITLRYKMEGLENILSTHDQTINRISFSIIIAALIIGSALIVISSIPPLFYGISLIGIVGFLAAAIMGIWLLVAILRKGRL
jgi:ubiquinone biosynthesis protein